MDPENRNVQEYAAGNRVRMEIVGSDSQPKDPWFVPKLATAEELKAMMEKTGHRVYLFIINEKGNLHAVPEKANG